MITRNGSSSSKIKVKHLVINKNWGYFRQSGHFLSTSFTFVKMSGQTKKQRTLVLTGSDLARYNASKHSSF